MTVPPLRLLAGTLLIWSLLLTGCQRTAPIGETSATPVPGASPTAGESPTEPLPEVSPRPVDMETVRAALDRAAAAFPGDSAVYLLDLETGEEYGVRADAPFESASLMKLPVLVELYRRVEVGELQLNDLHPVEERHKVGGSGALKNVENGQQFTLEELAQAMITDSDNTATEVLCELLTLQAIHENCRNLELTATTVERRIYDFGAIAQGHNNQTSARDMGRLLEQIALTELPGSVKMNEILERQKRDDMIGYGTEHTKVAHKTGELTGLLHDAGIVYAPRGSFVLVMLGDDITDPDAALECWRDLYTALWLAYTQETPF